MGHPQTAATREKIAAARRGRHSGAATRQKQREATKRMMADPEYRARIAAAHLGKTFSAEHKAAHAAAMRRPEVRQKLSAANRRRQVGAATRRKMGEATSRRMADPEYREKRLAAMHTPEYREKHAAAMQRPEVRAKLSSAMKRAMANPAIRATRRGKARGKNGPETAAESLLSPMGFLYHGRRFGRTLFDFTHPTLSSVVEIQGCYFHNHSAVGDCARKVRGLPGAAKKDERRREVAKSNGLRLLELWECERASWAATISSFMAQQK